MFPDLPAHESDLASDACIDVPLIAVFLQHIPGLRINPWIG
jgi:hypothetical protein